ncbi:membrane protein insertase YidC [Arhodomonas sp. SL1]|uniref:membrane protein insertase YidC n=1 Tax=Arhodomonas sp. SL1 TaxID=3425691 RepID=UPI003F882B4E
MENVRLFLFAALGALLLLLWSAWQEDYGQPVAGGDEEASPVAAAPEDAPEAERSSPADGAGEASQAETGAGPDTIRVLTDLFDIRIDANGGRIASARLRQHTVSMEDESPFPLLRPESPLFVAEAGLVGDGVPAPDAGARWRAEQAEYRLSEGDDALVVPLTWTGDNGVEITRRYVFGRDDYVLRVEHRVRNASESPYRAYQYAQLRREESGSGQAFLGARSYVGGVIFTPEDRYQKYDFGDMRDSDLSRDVTDGWLAFIQHYFVAAWIPPREHTQRFYTRVRHGEYVLGMSSPWQSVAPGGEATYSSQLFIGPKDQDRLAAIAEGLELTVDYGWFTVLSKPLFIALDWIHGVVGNWGWAIIILTLGIKAVFYKLSETSYRSMARMRKLQPRMQQLKERYGDDRQGMNQELMKLYKEEKVNPLGGCLPILIQIPVFIALYWVLLESVELRHAPWVLWIRDLSSPDPYYILPLIMGATMLLQQQLNPAPMDPIQKRLMTFLPVVFTVFFLFFPAGLVLYWVTNNTLSILQQWLITRRIEGEEAKKRAS